MFPPQRLTLLHVNSNQCLDMPSEEDKMVPTLRDCSGRRSQQWILRNMTLSVWQSRQHPVQTWISALTTQHESWSFMAFFTALWTVICWFMIKSSQALIRRTTHSPFTDPIVARLVSLSMSGLHPLTLRFTGLGSDHSHWPAWQGLNTYCLCSVSLAIYAAHHVWELWCLLISYTSYLLQ